jgi:hypothetical protein
VSWSKESRPWLILDLLGRERGGHVPISHVNAELVAAPSADGVAREPRVESTSSSRGWHTLPQRTTCYT